MRDRKPVALPVSALVPSDIVLLRTGDLVPADGIVLESEGLQLDESILGARTVVLGDVVASWRRPDNLSAGLLDYCDGSARRRCRRFHKQKIRKPTCHLGIPIRFNRGMRRGPDHS
jgi:hypothetical protein